VSFWTGAIQGAALTGLGVACVVATVGTGGLAAPAAIGLGAGIVAAGGLVGGGIGAKKEEDQEEELAAEVALSRYQIEAEAETEQAQSAEWSDAISSWAWPVAICALFLLGFWIFLRRNR
jgi:hypothetical protein